MPVAFDCECGERWWSPEVCRGRCGPMGTSVPDPVIWSVGSVSFVDRWEPYVAAAERWLAARS